MAPRNEFAALSPDGLGGLFQSRSGLLILGAAGVIFYGIGLVIYRLFLHPLANVPGPRLCAITENPFLYKEYVEGSAIPYVSDLFRQYGPIVRIGPNRLALDGSVAIPEVYNHRKGRPEFQKTPGFFFTCFPGLYPLIGAPTVDHRRQRRQLAHAFSETAMYEQEPIINKYVSGFIAKMSSFAETGEAFDFTHWLNYMTFDVIGDLTFGESFGCLDSGGYHPWVAGMFQGVRGSAYIRFLKYVALLKPLLLLAKLHPAMKKSMEITGLAITKARSRMAQGESPGGRRDFMTYMMRKNRDGEFLMSEKEILLNSPTLVIAGSETTASALSGMFFLLHYNRDIYKLLAEEIRGAFKTLEEINMRSTAGLQYLHAFIEEGLRLYPPVAATPPRISPGDAIGDLYVPEGTVVATYQWATFRNPKNFADPDSLRPERFLPSTHPLYDHKYDNDNRDCFKPFSSGPRDCIGKNLAYSEMRVVLSRFFFLFDYELAEGMDSWMACQRTFFVWQKPPLMARVYPRKS